MLTRLLPYADAPLLYADAPLPYADAPLLLVGNQVLLCQHVVEIKSVVSELVRLIPGCTLADIP